MASMLAPIRAARSLIQAHPTPRASHRYISSSTNAPQAVLGTARVPLSSSKGHVLVLSMNRPEARNALSRSLVADLTDALEAVHRSGPAGDTRAIVLSSAVNNIFCAGADLKERKSMTLDDTRAFLADLHRALDLLETLPIPSVAAVAGTALGGGLEIALCTTLRVFASTAVVGLPETRLAIIPGAGGTYRLPRLVGLSRARDIILTGRRLSAAEAYFVGLCNRLVQVLPEEQDESDKEALPYRARTRTLEESLKLAVEISEGGPIAIEAALEAIGGGPEAEKKAYEKVLASADRIEALNAFAEKRRPVYKGK